MAITYLQLHFLEIQHSDLWDFADDIEPVVLLVRDRIPQQTENKYVEIRLCTNQPQPNSGQQEDVGSHIPEESQSLHSSQWVQITLK
jgi:hypothetical protein